MYCAYRFQTLEKPQAPPVIFGSPPKVKATSQNKFRHVVFNKLSALLLSHKRQKSICSPWILQNWSPLNRWIAAIAMPCLRDHSRAESTAVALKVFRRFFRVVTRVLTSWGCDLDLGRNLPTHRIPGFTINGMLRADLIGDALGKRPLPKIPVTTRTYEPFFPTGNPYICHCELGRGHTQGIPTSL